MAKSVREPYSLEDDRSLPIFIHSAIDDMTQLPPNAMRVYMHLARRADKSGVAWPSYQAVGDHCFSCVCENPATRKTHARKAIDQLLDAGLIRKEERARDDGSQTSNAYVLVDPSQFSMGVLNRHGGAKYAAPMLIKQGPCLLSTKDTPIEDSPLKEGDGISSLWPPILEELRTAPPLVSKYLAGSRLEEIGISPDDKRAFRVTILAEHAHGLAWLAKQVTHSIKRSVQQQLKMSVELEFVAAQPEKEPAS